MKASAYICSNWIDEDVLVGNAPYDSAGFSAILSMGITRFVCLCDRSDLHFDYFDHLTDKCVMHYEPIQDRSTAPDDRAIFIAQWIIGQASTGHRVYLHCVGGIGRAGTIASLYLGLRYGYDSGEAMRRVNESRRTRWLLNHPRLRSPTSKCQRAQVRRLLDHKNESE